MAIGLRCEEHQPCGASSNDDLLDYKIVDGATVDRIRDCDGEKYTDHDRNDIGQCPSKLRADLMSSESLGEERTPTSNMITASDTVVLVTPASVAVAPTIA